MRRDRTAILHFLAQLVRSLAGFGTTLFTARYFGAGGLGVYSQILALLFWLKLPSNSIKVAVTKRMSESESLTGHFTAGIVTSIGYGLAVGVVLFLFRDFVNDYLNAEGAVFLGLLLLVNILFDLTKSGFAGRQRVAVSGWLGTAEQVLRLASQVAFVLGGVLVIGLVYGHILSLFVFTCLGLWLLRDRLTIPTGSDFTDLRRFAQYSWLGNLKGVTLSWMDILVLGYFVAEEFVGIYTAAWTLASFLSLASKSINDTLFPELSELGAEDRIDRAVSLVSDGLMFTGVFLIPGALGALVIGDRILAVYADEFSTGATILVLLILARTLHGFGSQFVGALNGLDYPEVAFRVNAVFLVTNVVLNVTLVSLFGWYGAAYATLTATGVYLVGGWFLLRTTVDGVTIPVTEILHQAVAAVVMAGLLRVAVPTLPRTLPVTLLTVFAGAAVYAAVLLGISGRLRNRVLAIV